MKTYILTENGVSEFVAHIGDKVIYKINEVQFMCNTDEFVFMSFNYPYLHDELTII